MPSPDPARILRQHLQTDRLLGADAVPVPEGLSGTLTRSGVAKQGQAPRGPASRSEAAIDGAYAKARSAAPLAASLRDAGPVRSRSTAPPPASTKPAQRYPVLAGLSTVDKEAKLAELRERLEADPAVQATRPAGTTLAWSDGSVDADIMFIGEGPGEVEDRLGLPFVGPAGELLNKMVTAMGLRRGDVYIANVVKYRPPGNRVPTPEEAAVSGPYLAQQAAIVAPRAIVALGGSAAKFTLQTHLGITKIRGQWGRFNFTDPPIDLMPTFHPAYLLRSYTTDNRKKVWEDLQAVLKRIG